MSARPPEWRDGMYFFKRRTRCRRCQEALEGENLKIGCCDRCVEAEFRELKKRIPKSLAGGVVLLILVLAARHYACSSWYTGEYGEVVIPLWAWVLKLKPEKFESLMYPSLLRGSFVLLYVFCLPFSSYVEFGYKTYRHEAEQRLSGGDPLVYRQVISSSGQRMDDVGIFIIQTLVALVSGPFFLIYRLHQWRQMSKYLKSR